MHAIVLAECLGLSVIFEDDIFCDFRDSIAECVCTERSCWCAVFGWDERAKARLASYGEEYRRCIVKPLVLFLPPCFPLPMVFLPPALSSSCTSHTTTSCNAAAQFISSCSLKPSILEVVSLPSPCSLTICLGLICALCLHLYVRIWLGIPQESQKREQGSYLLLW